MTRRILDLSEAPDDPIERLMWLSGVAEQVKAELDAEWQQAYFWARFSGRMDAALALGLHSKKRAMQYTRTENEARARMIRWNDGR